MEDQMCQNQYCSAAQSHLLYLKKENFMMVKDCREGDLDWSVKKKGVF